MWYNLRVKKYKNGEISMQDNLTNLEKGKQVLKTLINNGYEAYFFGETVRCEVMKLESDVVMIMTSALVSDLSKMFGEEFKKIDNQCCSFVFNNCEFFVKSFIDEEKLDSTYKFNVSN